MNTTRWIFVALLAAAASACSPPATPTDDGGDGAVGTDDSATADGASGDGGAFGDASAPNMDATTADDGGTSTGDAAIAGDGTSPPTGDACAPPAGAPPDLMGLNACGTLDFGMPAATPTMVSAAIVFNGGAVLPGIYDAVGYSRTTGSLMASYRATLVVGSGFRYTEVRQLTTSPGNPGPITRRSGVLMPMGSQLNRTVTCDSADGGTDMMSTPYSVETRCDGVFLHIGTTNLWFTYRRR